LGVELQKLGLGLSAAMGLAAADEDEEAAPPAAAVTDADDEEASGVSEPNRELAILESGFRNAILTLWY
jgi:hypothetical protein